MKWEKAPREINPKLSAAAATMVYFAGNGEFGLLSGTVYKEAHRISASAGDGESVYVGTWSADGNTIRVIYQLIYHDIRAVGEQLPGPAQKVNFQFDQATRLLKASGSTGLKLDGWEYEINLELSKATVEAQLGIGMKFGKSDN